MASNNATISSTSASFSTSSSSISSISSTLSSSVLDTSSSTTSSLSLSSSSSLETTSASSDSPPTTTEVPVTSTVTGPVGEQTTQIVTSIVTQSGNNGATQVATTVIVVTSSSATNTPVSPTTKSASSSTSSGAASLGGNSNDRQDGGSHGLSTGGKTAIAVVIPVVVVALLVLAGILLWRKRKQKKENEEQRRKEVEDYSFNPNTDPTIPAVASEGGPEMTEDGSGYRGWGAGGAAMSNRKTSTTLTGGNTQGPLSDAGSKEYYTGNNGDGHSGDPLVNRRETSGSDDLGVLGAAPLAGMHHTGGAGVHRGPSNASSRYSAGTHSDGSEEPVPPLPVGQAYDYNPGAGYGYNQHGPYGDGTYGGGGGNAGAMNNGMPVVRDVDARRNTRIQQAAGNYQQGNSGIAQNF
ncbi:hypothetical protein K431DRAFT_305083 [Polychaeton citri CBS 116435]|uniref:Uncharacterized protein n=1 Tax=Polychaeton citri CBS 116435 TaxID=1314669 RepID=A0A9P4Q548_9PEZI|nr:hypothetical protein K431DRAFT_305083 [Polychaeton citri CBS 116435]